MALLRYTGHPLVDVGVATGTAFSHKQRPEDVTVDDLTAIADYLKDIYCHIKSIQNFISTIFLNSAFVQHAKSLEEKQQYADSVLYAFQEDTPILEGEQCIFFPEKPAVLYAHRQFMPLLNGSGIANFSPLGASGIPISGVALLVIHIMPLGCMKCGNLLSFHQLRGMSDGQDMTVILARQALEKNRAAILDMRLDPEKELPNYGSYKKTRYIEALLQAQQSTQRRKANWQNITGYYFTNYGPKPDLQLVRLDNAVADFVHTAQQDASQAWNRSVYATWQRPKGEEAISPDETNTHTWRNYLYEALFDLPQNARRFLGHLEQGRDWQLIAIFLRKVLLMEQERIETYKMLGDLLGDYLLGYEAPALGFYHKFARADKYFKLRDAIRSAEEKMMKAGEAAPIFTLERFVLAFETPSEGYRDWRLGRDLIAMRIREIIFQNRDRFNLGELPDVPETDETEENEE